MSKNKLGKGVWGPGRHGMSGVHCSRLGTQTTITNKLNVNKQMYLQGTVWVGINNGVNNPVLRGLPGFKLWVASTTSKACHCSGFKIQA